MTRNQNHQVIELCRYMLKQELKKIHYVGDEVLDELVDIFYLQEFPKKTQIIKKGKTSNELFFVVRGMLKRYHTVDNREIIIDFIDENKFFMNSYSLITGDTNKENYETLEYVVCMVADYNDFEQLIKQHHSLCRLARKMTENQYINLGLENYNKLFVSLEERYETFIRERSKIAFRVNQKHIASYLGVTQETLSRLRSRHYIAHLQENLTINKQIYP